MKKYIYPTSLLIFIIVIIILIFKLLEFNNNSIFVCRTLFKVIDGDTFYYKNFKIRILGIDALELYKQKKYVLKKIKKKNMTCLRYYAYLAKKELEKILNNYCIKIEILDKDKYGRLLAKLYNCSDSRCMDIGKYFVEKGLAISFRNYYKNEEEYAKRHKLGLWSCN